MCEVSQFELGLPNGSAFHESCCHEVEDALGRARWSCAVHQSPPSARRLPARSSRPARLASSRLRRWLVGEVTEQRVRIGEGGGEDLFRDGEELRDARVSDAVVDAGARPAAFEDSLLA